jgi:hypothetical protein
MSRIFFLLAGLFALCFSACSSSSGSAYYRYSSEKGGYIVDGRATVTDDAPDEVKAAIEAGNRIAHLPYHFGGGRCQGIDHRGYDCSGATSYVLREAGLLGTWMTSSGFRKYGKSGRGEWITVYARSGHVFLEVAGLRFDTGYQGRGTGPRWTTKSRPMKGAVLRHPPGL